MSLPEYLQARIAAETQLLRVPDDFVLESGAVLRDVDIAYRTWGDPANAAERAILICHALTGDQYVGFVVFDRIEQVLRPLEAACLHVGLAERLFQHPANGVVVIDDPDVERALGHHAGPA